MNQVSDNLPRLSVLLPTYRQPQVLLLTIRDLVKQDYPRGLWELVLLDDGSGDASAQLAVAATPTDIPLTVRRHPSGGIYSHARIFNQLLKLADPGSEVFVHIEDSRVRPDYLRRHANWHQGDSLALVTGPMCEGAAETFAPEACGRWELMQMSGATVDAYKCCFQAIFAKSMSYRRRLAGQLTDGLSGGPFDEAMSGWGYHETEFAYRAEAAGVLCVYDVRCGVYHPSHEARDDLEYRGVNRDSMMKEGASKNVAYLCAKHGLSALPDWKVGVPLESPQLPRASSEP